jgi:hypothetical protein
MVKNRIGTLLIIFFSVTFSHLSWGQFQVDSFIEKLLKKDPERFADILGNSDKYQLQILYTRIDRNKNNEPRFQSYGYHVDPSKYFYPASTVKLAAAVVALEKLNRLGIDKNAHMFTESARSEQTAVTADTTSEDGFPSVAHYIRKIFLASDNDAFNRLYEFIGQEELNETLHRKGYQNVRIVHRLDDTSFDSESNRYTNPVRFEMHGKTIYQQPATYASKTYFASSSIPVGAGHVEDGALTDKPFDFAQKNYFALEDQHRLMKAVFFPDQTPPQQRFDLTNDDYTFLYKYMSQFPVETSFPEHYTDDYYDGYVKYLMFGGTQTRLPRHIRLFNKSGEGYGYLLDNAYIADFEKGIEFLLTAVIYVNADGIINDDKYDYKSIGLPFMANLGKAIFNYELNRKRTTRPDLDRFEVAYDK